MCTVPLKDEATVRNHTACVLQLSLGVFTPNIFMSRPPILVHCRSNSSAWRHDYFSQRLSMYLLLFTAHGNVRAGRNHAINRQKS